MDIEILRKTDEIIEEFYDRSKRMGAELAHLFKNKNQIKSLENIICSTTRFTEAKNFVKNQIGKSEKGKNWTKKVKNVVEDKEDEIIGEQILNELRHIERKAEEITETNLVYEVKMRLLRGWIKQVAAHYEYKLKLGEIE